MMRPSPLLATIAPILSPTKWVTCSPSRLAVLASVPVPVRIVVVVGAAFAVVPAAAGATGATALAIVTVTVGAAAIAPFTVDCTADPVAVTVASTPFVATDATSPSIRKVVVSTGAPSTLVVTVAARATSMPPGSVNPPRCAASSPSLSAGAQSPEAGASSPFTLTVTRADRTQYLSRIAATLPAGMLARLATATQCQDAAAAAGACPASSQVGTTSALSGPGAAPLALTGRVYLTGPYRGAPFGLSIVVPAALPGILTGTILALSRAVGETAPLITLGALTFIAFLPELSLEGLQSPFTVLPIQIFNWVSRPQHGFHANAAAGIVVLLVVLLLMNAAAVLLRNKYQRRL